MTLPKNARRGLLALVTLVCVEIMSYAGGRLLAAKGIFYVAQSTEGYAAYLASRDPELGWPRITGEHIDFDASGSRFIPAFPDATATPCISLYGDSFTFGEEVDDEHNWANQLARRAGCRVADYGFVGFGTDQALLRFRHNQHDRAKVELLGFLTENILRNVNRFRNLLAPTAGVGFKPRFVVNADSALELIPLPSPTEEQFREMVHRPELTLDHEYFVPGGPSGVSTLSFPFTASIIGLYRNFHVRAALRGEPSYAAFFSPDHDAGALAVTAAIMTAFVHEAADRGAWSGVVIIPLPGDLNQRRREGTAVHQPLMDELTRAGIPFLDSAERFLSALNGGDPCKLYTRCGGGHFTEEANLLLSGYVHDWLKAQAGFDSGKPRANHGKLG